MGEKSVEAVFNALFALTDIRGILRDSVPKHELKDEQKKKAKKAVEKARKNIERIEEDLGL